MHTYVIIRDMAEYWYLYKGKITLYYEKGKEDKRNYWHFYVSWEVSEAFNCLNEENYTYFISWLHCLNYKYSHNCVKFKVVAHLWKWKSNRCNLYVCSLKIKFHTQAMTFVYPNLLKQKQKIIRPWMSLVLQQKASPTTWT